MIVVDFVEIGGAQYQRTYSDGGMMIERDGARYSEAIDPVGSGREYTETDEMIPDGEAEEADYIAALIDSGVMEDV